MHAHHCFLMPEPHRNRAPGAISASKGCAAEVGVLSPSSMSCIRKPVGVLDTTVETLKGQVGRPRLYFGGPWPKSSCMAHTQFSSQCDPISKSDPAQAKPCNLVRELCTRMSLSEEGFLVERWVTLQGFTMGPQEARDCLQIL